MILCWVKTRHFTLNTVSQGCSQYEANSVDCLNHFCFYFCCFFFMVESKLLLGKEFNCGHCLSQFFFSLWPCSKECYNATVNFVCSSTFCWVECTNHKPPCQGSYRSWKTWKVMEFYNFIFQAWKVLKFWCGLWKSLVPSP